MKTVNGDTYARSPNPQNKNWDSILIPLTFGQQQKFRDLVFHLSSNLVPVNIAANLERSAKAFTYLENHQTVKRGVFKKRKHFRIVSSQ